ncbi:hypothetical protein N7524_012175 [Penicillium chrysogenum]|nr:hypothetical protein N7524_012175 [Penicillium chrysogenum]
MAPHQRSSRFQADFDQHGDIRTSRVPLDPPMIVWVNGLPWFQVYKAFYVLRGSWNPVSYLVAPPAAVQASLEDSLTQLTLRPFDSATCPDPDATNGPVDLILAAVPRAQSQQMYFTRSHSLHAQSMITLRSPSTLFTTYLHPHLSSSPVFILTYLHPHLSSPPVFILTYLHPHLSSSSPIFTLTYLHPHLSSPPVFTLTYLHPHLSSSSPIFILTYLHPHLSSPSPVFTLTCLHHLSSPSPIFSPPKQHVASTTVSLPLRVHTWCLTCLRVSVRDQTEASLTSLRPFVAQCFAETYDAKNCQHCNKLNKPCETVPEGVEGNRDELLAYLRGLVNFVHLVFSSCHLSIAIHSSTLPGPIEAYLVDNLKANLLIGMDVMGHEGFRLDLDAKTLRISSCMNIEIPIVIHAKPHHAAQRGTTLKKEPQSQAGFKKQDGRQPESLTQHASVSYPFHCWIKSLNTFLRLTELICLGLLRILLSSPLWLGHLGHLFYTFEGPEQFLEELREEHGYVPFLEWIIHVLLRSFAGDWTLFG